MRLIVLLLDDGMGGRFDIEDKTKMIHLFANVPQKHMCFA